MDAAPLKLLGEPAAVMLFFFYYFVVMNPLACFVSNKQVIVSQRFQEPDNGVVLLPVQASQAFDATSTDFGAILLQADHGATVLHVQACELVRPFADFKGIADPDRVRILTIRPTRFISGHLHSLELYTYTQSSERGHGFG
jgi:hypothetical protein